MLDAITNLHTLLVEDAGESKLLAAPEGSGARRLERRFQCPFAVAEQQTIERCSGGCSDATPESRKCLVAARGDTGSSIASGWASRIP